MSVFLDSIDLMERIMTSQYDYEELHQKFDASGHFANRWETDSFLSGELHEVGLALQSGFPASSQRDLDALQAEQYESFL